MLQFDYPGSSYMSSRVLLLDFSSNINCLRLETKQESSHWETRCFTMTHGSANMPGLLELPCLSLLPGKIILPSISGDRTGR